MKPILQTPRLLLREMHHADLDFLAEMLGDPEVMRYYPKTEDRAGAAANIQRQMDRYAQWGYGPWLVIHKETGEPIGRVGVIHQVVEGVGEAEVGYMIHRPFWRQGFAFEAAAACRDYVFNTLGRERVISLIRPENLPSQAVARKIGMQPEQEIMHHELRHIVFAMMRPATKD
ncbi:MAG: GNAT family N-acetyltransferase [Planctomycetales bacterium]|nr:GNAT family N-acetyltransferase [Planctomycetales bacterium]